MPVGVSAGRQLRQRIIRGGFCHDDFGAARKKPKALPPWAESTNEGGGGDNRLDRLTLRLLRGAAID
jgi:hypothetical protein